MRELSELLSPESAWPLVQEWIAAAAHPVEALPPGEPARSDTLLALQITTRSPMGAVAYETGGLLVDHGWLRILGSGHPRLPRTLPGWNRGRTWHGPESPPLLIVADDVLGGSFAIDGGSLGGEYGHVHYFAPDRLAWESLQKGYSDFLAWALTGDVREYYGEERWEGWREEVSALPGDRAFSVYPPLWARGPAIAERSRRAIPMSELFDLQFELRRQLGAERGR